MRTTYTASIAAYLALLLASQSARACGYGVPSLMMRMGLADRVVVGKVILIEPGPVSALLPDGSGRLKYVIAVVKIEETLKGNPGVTHVRIGLLPHQLLHRDFEGCFFLAEHPRESFLVQASDFFDRPLDRKSARFASQIESLRHMGELLRDPVTALGCGKAEDRLLTASLLLTQCRTFRQGIHLPNQTAPLDGQTSKLILQVLREANWSQRVGDFRQRPVILFHQLGATPKDGLKITSARTSEEFESVAKRWLKENEETFRIPAFVRR